MKTPRLLVALTSLNVVLLVYFLAQSGDDGDGAGCRAGAPRSRARNRG